MNERRDGSDNNLTWTRRVFDDSVARGFGKPEELRAMIREARERGRPTAQEMSSWVTRIKEAAAKRDQLPEQQRRHLNRSPLWIEALEQQFAALRLANAVCSDDEAHSHIPGIVAASTIAAQHLRKSEAFAWTSETITAALAASVTMPAEAVLDGNELPARACWWWFEDPLPFPSVIASDEILDSTTAAALTIARLDHDEVEIVIFRRLKVSPHWPGVLPGCSIAMSLMRVPARTPLWKLHADVEEAATAGNGDQFRMGVGYQLVRFVVAACAWLRQRVVIETRGHIERHRRKQLSREHNLPMPSDVKVIQLRREEARVTAAAEAASVDWSCRWIVNGFWRNQPYKNGHRVIYINPFIKGPADKPLRVPTHTVYQVSR